MMMAVQAAPTIAAIKQAVAARAGLTPEQLAGARRQAEVVQARQLAMWLAREMTGASLPSIGFSFGNRDHTTVMHACEQVERRLDDEPAFAVQVEQLRSGLSSAAVVDLPDSDNLTEILAAARRSLVERAKGRSGRSVRGSVQEIEAELSRGWGEQLVSAGTDKDGAETRIWAHPSGATWTLLRVDAAGEAVIVGAGTDWRAAS